MSPRRDQPVGTRTRPRWRHPPWTRQRDVAQRLSTWFGTRGMCVRIAPSRPAPLLLARGSVVVIKHRAVSNPSPSLLLERACTQSSDLRSGCHMGVAQLEEQRSPKPPAGGSSPLTHAIGTPCRNTVSVSTRAECMHQAVLPQARERPGTSGHHPPDPPTAPARCARRVTRRWCQRLSIPAFQAGGTSSNLVRRSNGERLASRPRTTTRSSSGGALARHASGRRFESSRVDPGHVAQREERAVETRKALVRCRA